MEQLDGLTASAFAKVNDENTFSKRQRMFGGLVFPAVVDDETGGKESAGLDFESSISKTTNIFRLAAKPSSGHTSPASRLEVLFGTEPGTVHPTGLSINPDGTVNFASGQQLPSTAVLAAINAGGGLPESGTNDPENPATASIPETRYYSWSQTSTTAQSIVPGFNSVTLHRCPPGVNGDDHEHFIYITGTGKPESVLITGGELSE